MKCAVYCGKQDIRVEERSLPTPGAGQVLLRVYETGICGSDMLIFAGKHPRAQVGLVPAHEIYGKIESSGSPEWMKGDRVAVYPLISCGHCDPCISGNAHVCQRLGVVGIDRAGGFAEFVVVDTDQLVRVPDAISDDDGVIIEPLAVAVHAVHQSAFKTGDAVLVTGAGPIGNLLAQTLRASGASRVIVSEVSSFAESLPAVTDFQRSIHWRSLHPWLCERYRERML